MSSTPEPLACVFCGRQVRTKKHHIVPKSKGGKIIKPTCLSCEDFIHRTYSHNELRDFFNTVEKVQADDRYQRFLRWLLKQQTHAVFRSSRNRQRPPDRFQRRRL